MAFDKPRLRATFSCFASESLASTEQSFLTSMSSVVLLWCELPQVDKGLRNGTGPVLLDDEVDKSTLLSLCPVLLERSSFIIVGLGGFVDTSGDGVYLEQEVFCGESNPKVEKLVSIDPEGDIRCGEFSPSGNKYALDVFPSRNGELEAKLE